MELCGEYYMCKSSVAFNVAYWREKKKKKKKINFGSLDEAMEM